MPDNASAADSAKSEHHFLGKHRWRGKLFSNEAKILQSDELQGPQGNDLVEFLQTPTKRKVSIQHQGTTPKLEDDVSTTSRLPLVPAVDNAGLQSTSHPRRKPPRRKGLRVNFDSARPVIIGEGGDEAELPSIDVRNSLLPRSPWQQPPGQDVPHYPRRASPGVDNAPNIRWSLRQGLQNESTDNDASFRPPPLRRQSTGFHSLEPEDEIHPLDRGLQREDACTELLEKPHSMSSPASDSNSESFAAIYVSHNQVTPLSPEIVVEQSGPRLEKECLAHEDDAEDLNAFSSLKPSSPEFEASVGNSLTPIPSPQPTTTQAALSLGYNFPSPASEQRTPSHVEAVTPQYQGTSINDVSKANAESRSPTRPPLKSPPVSLRNVAKSLGEDAFNAFLMRVQRFNAIFRLGAAANKSFANVPFAQWIRAGTWWFLKGRGELESAVRGRPSSSDSFQHSSKGDLPTGLKQAYLNLAKACWILMEVVPSHEELKKYGNVGIAALSPIVRNFGDSKLADMLEVYHAVVSNMRALTMSMKRNSKLPPDDFEPQGLNSRIWVETPRFASGVASILAGISSRNILDEGSAGFDSFPYPVGDTPRHFNYGNMFVDVVLSSSDVTQGSLQLPCILTILRQRTDRELEVVLASQDGHITLTVQSDRRAGPTWRDAHWKTNRFSILLKLADGLELDIQFQEQSFRSLWGIYDYTRRVRKQTESGEAEEVLFDTTVRCVHYVDSPDAKSFPLDPVRSCDILLMEKTLTIAEGTGRRRFHDGHRLVVVTPPSSKTLSSINHSLGKETPILFTYVRGEKDGPALLLKNEAAGSTLVITFNDPSSRDFFHTLLNGTLLKVDEFCTRSLPLRSMRIDTLEGESPIGRGNHLSDWHWQDLRVINRKPEHFEDGLPKTILSENLRIWAQCDAGTFVDRINLGQEELQMSLSVNKPTEMTLLRLPQQDMTICFASNLVSANKAKLLNDSIHIISTIPSARSYMFNSLTDLHYFQACVTGFSVLYEGTVNNLGISRRRMVVPMYRRWEASFARLQIIQRDTVIQLLVFFKEFPHGTCMNFLLKTTDQLESLSKSVAKSEQYYIRIVDAKFALPKKATEPGSDFVCLDTPEYPSEHDDITIGFDSEAERDRFGSALPAAVNKFSRLGSLRKGVFEKSEA